MVSITFPILGFTFGAGMIVGFILGHLKDIHKILSGKREPIRGIQVSPSDLREWGTFDLCRISSSIEQELENRKKD